MNGLDERASEAVRRAVESPAAGPEDRGTDDEFDADGDGGRRPRRQRQRQQQPQPRERRPRRRRSAEGGDADANSSTASGRSRSPPRRRGGESVSDSDDNDDDDDHTDDDSSDERAARGEVGEYVPPGGSVELGMFGKKVASFHQVTTLKLEGRGMATLSVPTSWGYLWRWLVVLRRDNRFGSHRWGMFVFFSSFFCPVDGRYIMFMTDVHTCERMKPRRVLGKMPRPHESLPR